MEFEGAKEYILARLARELDPTLCYHSIHHTHDVYEAAVRIAELEKVAGRDLNLLLTAALFHDAGMMVGYENHEEVSATMAREILPSFRFTEEDIAVVTGLILVTRLPQNAGSKLEEIICDADLDYLGRDDFFIHSFQLRLEWDLHGVRKSSLKEWLEIQVQFLSGHNYFTKSAIALRDELKQKHLYEVQNLLKGNH
jgi:predicted metal-dependent HD superfamily phosphohydrolase